MFTRQRVLRWLVRGVFALTLALSFDWLYTNTTLLLALILGSIAVFWFWRSYKNIPPIRGVENAAGPHP